MGSETRRVAVGAIFRDAGHALHVSFLIHSLPPTLVSPTAVVLSGLAKPSRVWDDAAGLSPGCAVNFAGLSAQDIRAQAAMVVAAVKALPHPGERAACLAFYGHQALKAEGVRGLAEFCAPAVGAGVSDDFLLYCAWAVFASKAQRAGLGVGSIAKHHCVSVAKTRATCAAVRRYAHALLDRALATLGRKFVQGGLIGV